MITEEGTPVSLATERSSRSGLAAAPGKEGRSAHGSNARPHNNSFGSRLSNMEKASARQAREFKQLESTLLKTSKENSDTLVELLQILQTWELVPREPSTSESSMDNEKVEVKKDVERRKTMHPWMQTSLQATAGIISLGGAFLLGRAYEKRRDQKS